VGLFAVAGLLFVAAYRRTRLWGAYLLFGFLYFLTLIPVFYGTRFSLPMLAFYSAAAIAPFGWERLSEMVAGIERRFPVRIFAFLLIWMPGALTANARTQDPGTRVDPGRSYETLEAADYLSAHAQGGILLARKPHVAFLSHMRFAPIPQINSPAELHRAARQAGASYLLVSGAEMALRAGVRPLAQPEARVPGSSRSRECGRTGLRDPSRQLRRASAGALTCREIRVKSTDPRGQRSFETEGD